MRQLIWWESAALLTFHTKLDPGYKWRHFFVGQETLVYSMWCESKRSIEFDISSVPYSLVSSLCRDRILRPVPTTSAVPEASTPRCQPWPPFSPVVRRQDRRIRGRSARVRILPPRRDFTRPSRLSLHTRVSKPWPEWRHRVTHVTGNRLTLKTWLCY